MSDDQTQEILDLKDRGLNNTQIANQLGIGESTVRRRLIKAKQNTTDAKQILVDLEKADPKLPTESQARKHIKDMGLDPDEYSIEWIKSSQYEIMGKDGVETLNSSRVSAKKKGDLDKKLEIAKAGALKKISIHPPKRSKKVQESEIHILFSDPHFPLEDKHLCHEIFPQFLRDVQPHSVNSLGDMIDNKKLSRFVDRKSTHDNNFQEGIEAAHEWYAHIASSVPSDTDLRWIEGNHDGKRLEEYIVGRAPELARLRRAGTEQDILDFGYLLHIQQFGWQQVEHEFGNYPHAKIELIPGKVKAQHGHKTGANTGSKYLQKMGQWECCFYGHVHTQAIDCMISDGKQKTSVGVGTMGHLHHDYQEEDDVNAQAGFAVLRIFDDGRYIPSLAMYRHGTLLWEGYRW